MISLFVTWSPSGFYVGTYLIIAEEFAGERRRPAPLLTKNSLP
jgi:hypothetical protein